MPFSSIPCDRSHFSAFFGIVSTPGDLRMTPKRSKMGFVNGAKNLKIRKSDFLLLGFSGSRIVPNNDTTCSSLFHKSIRRAPLKPSIE